ncbi:MAG: hypothetical protein NUV60_00540 [Patescibacteria group bacterium]|nr:hypothetical protein [Patescibacteria group bacterium]
MKVIHRVGRIVLLVQCIVRAIFYGAANRIPSKISRVVVHPDGKLGDVVCCTPVLVALRANLPEAHLIVAGNSKLHRPLLSDSGLVDEYIDLGEKGALSHIKACKADVALVTGVSFDAAALFYVAGIPLVVAPVVVGGESEQETRLYKILQRFIKTFPYRIGAYAPRERLRVLEPLNIFFDDTKKRLGFSEDAKRNVENVLNKIVGSYTYLVGISAGVGNKEKLWDPEKFAAVANYFIQKRGAHIVVLGGKSDAPESAKMIAAIEDKSKISDATLTSIDDLKAMIAKLDVFVGVNTGPIYIAEAFDVPTVDLIGPVNPWDQPPQGKIHKMVFPPGEPKPLLNMLNTRNHDVKEAERIAHSTRLEDVIMAVEEALKEVDALRLARKK